jgi:HK97 family phage major capsid protein
MTLDARFKATLDRARRMNDALGTLTVKENREPTPAEIAAVDEAVAEAKALRRELDGRKALDQLTAGMALDGGATGYPPSLPPAELGYVSGGVKMESIGRQFVGSDQYKQARETGLFKGQGWTLPTVTVETKATLTEGAGGGGAALAQPELVPGIVPLALPRLTIAALLPSGATVSNAVRMLVESSFTNAAAATAEGAAKPESAMVFTQVDEPVSKIAHWLPVSDEMLEDAPQLQSFIDARLTVGVQLVEEQQLLNGDGTPPNLTGILKRNGLAAPVARTGSQSNADAVLAQITAIEASGAFTVDSVVLNPANWASVIGSKDSQGRYYGMGPLAGRSDGDFIWGRRVVTTPAIAAGTGIVAAFRQSTIVFRRSGVDLSATNSHQDFFTKNLTAIRAEERLALAVYQPAAIGLVTGLN